MIKTVTSTFCLILILTTQAWSQGQSRVGVSAATEASRFSGEWRLRFYGVDTKDEQAQAKLVDIRTDLKAKYSLHETFYLDFQPSLRFVSGQTQLMDGADKPESKVSLQQAAAHFQPVSFVRFSAGALNQDYMHTGLLVDPIAFPAGRAEAMLKIRDFKTSLAVESAVPTSTSLSTNTKELEPTPSLNTAMLKMSWMPSTHLYVKTSVGYFIYNNLPSAVAQKSYLLGNSITKASEAQYNFNYQYEGLEASAEVEVPIFSVLDLGAGAEYVKNQKGPQDENTASYYYGKGEVHITKNTDLIIRGGYFSVEPEAAVSYFNSIHFETNRIGYIAETTLAFKKLGFSIGAKYIDSEVMYTNSIQSREKTLLLKLETFYVHL